MNRWQNKKKLICFGWFFVCRIFIWNHTSKWNMQSMFSWRKIFLVFCSDFVQMISNKFFVWNSICWKLKMNVCVWETATKLSIIRLWFLCQQICLEKRNRRKLISVKWFHDIWLIYAICLASIQQFRFPSLKKERRNILIDSINTRMSI